MSRPKTLYFLPILISAAIFLSSGTAFSQNPSEFFENLKKNPPPVPTLGGIHFWGDIYFYQEWRIQHNAMLKSYRLLDPTSRQYAFGTREQCEKRLAELKGTIPEVKGRVLVLMHGLAANRLTMQRMAGWFRQRGNYVAVINITYPSSEITVRSQAAMLGEIIKNLDFATEIDLVGHSLGSIIIRCYLGNPPGGEKGKLPDPRIRRFVQLCPPNGGSGYAKAAGDFQISQNFAGGPIRDLGLTYAEMRSEFGVPACEFGIVAGGLDNDSGYSSMLDGDDDGVIPVSTTPLENAADYVLLKANHAIIPNMVETFEHVERFLENGYFRTEELKKKIFVVDFVE